MLKVPCGNYNGIRGSLQWNENQRHRNQIWSFREEKAKLDSLKKNLDEHLEEKGLSWNHFDELLTN